MLCISQTRPKASRVSNLPLTHILILAVIQGVTEFLPISSSGHLILIPKLTGLNDQGLMLDVAVHVGTLLAVILYFWRDMFKITRSLIRAPRQAVNMSAFDAEFWIFWKFFSIRDKKIILSN